MIDDYHILQCPTESYMSIFLKIFQISWVVYRRFYLIENIHPVNIYFAKWKTLPEAARKRKMLGTE